MTDFFVFSPSELPEQETRHTQTPRPLGGHRGPFHRGHVGVGFRTQLGPFQVRRLGVKKGGARVGDQERTLVFFRTTEGTWVDECGTEDVGGPTTRSDGSLVQSRPFLLPLTR